MTLTRKPGQGFTWRAALIGGLLVALWAACLARAAPAFAVRHQYTAIILAFGAVFTFFVVKLAFYRAGAAVAVLLAAGVSVVLFALGGFAGLTLPRLPSVRGIWLLVALTVVLTVPFYLFVLKRLLPRSAGISPEELAVIYAILVAGIGGAFVTKISVESATEYWKDEWKLEKWLPPHFLPEPDARAQAPPGDAKTASQARSSFYQDRGAREGWLNGRSKVPWIAWLFTGGDRNRPLSEWTFPLFFWIVLVLTFEFFFLLVALVFRKRWVEEERLPFPMAQYPITLIGDGSAAHDRSVFAGRAPWIAFGIGLALCAYSLIRISPTNFQSVEPGITYLFAPQLQTRVDLTGYRFVPDFTFLIWLSPFALLFIIFAPSEVMLTMLVTFFIINVLLNWIIAWFGLHTEGLVDYLSRGLTLGGVAGLVFWSFVFNWKTLARLFAAFFRGTKGPEEGRIWSLRTALIAFWAVSMLLAVAIYPRNFGSYFTATSRWLLLGGTAFVFLYVLLSRLYERRDASEDVPLGARSLILLIACLGLSFVALTLPGRTIGLVMAGSAVAFSYVFGSMRIHAENPMTDLDFYHAGRLDAAIQARYLPGPSAPGVAAPENHWWNTPEGVESQFYGWGFASFFRIYGPQGWFLGAFKVGHDTGTRANDILKAIVFALLVGALVAAPMTLHYGYKYGYSTGRPLSTWSEDTFTWMNRTYIFGTSPMEPPIHFDRSKLYTLPLMCFVVVGVLMYLRREYSWWPFHPVGFVTAGFLAGNMGNPGSFWFTIFIAWLLKRQIFRWFGVRFFRQRVQPLFVFAMMGIVMGIIIYLLRFTLEFGVGALAWH